jgi:hypothetical protein
MTARNEPGRTRCWVLGSFGMRSGIYLAPERGVVNFCGTMSRDIGGQQRCMPSLPSEERGQELSVDCHRTVRFRLSTATSLKKFFGGKAEGRIPLNGHHGQSAGAVVSDFSPMRARPR